MQSIAVARCGAFFAELLPQGLACCLKRPCRCHSPRKKRTPQGRRMISRRKLRPRPAVRRAAVRRAPDRRSAGRVRTLFTAATIAAITGVAVRSAGGTVAAACAPGAGCDDARSLSGEGWRRVGPIRNRRGQHDYV